MTTLRDLVAWAEALAAHEARAVDPAVTLDPPDAGGPLRERALASLRPESIADLLGGGGGARGALRVAVPLYLATAAADLERAYRSRRVEALAPWQGDVDAVLAGEPDGDRRRAIAGRFRAAVDRLASLRDEREAARDEAARRAGARDARALAAAGRDPEAAAAADEVERGFIAPTDDALASAMRERGGGSIAAEDVPRMAWLADRRPLLDPGRVRGVLRGMAGALGLDATSLAAGSRPASLALDGVPPPAWVVVGTWGGPRGLRDALLAFGRAARATFVAATRGGVARATSDPAFAFAAEALFGGIPASAAGLRAVGLPDDPTLLAEIRLERLIAARGAWSVLAAADAPAHRRTGLLVRAHGRPLAPGEADALEHDERDACARLSGVSYAILLEERLLTRFGRAWFTRPEAGAFLRDLWAAEPDATPRVMAGDLALGTMDSAPLLEACQPTKGRVS